jgi:hypothetical protein
MRRLLTIFTVLLFSSVLSFAEGPPSDTPGKPATAGQGHDDHSDSGAIQVGYGIVTPVASTTSGTTTGLVVFETFGARSSGGNADATQAGVLPPDLTTNAILFVDSSGRLSKNTGVAIVNPNSSNVNVTMILRKSDGTPVGTATVNVPSHQQISKYVTELFAGQSSVPSDVTGTLAITSAGSSNLPVSVTGLRFRGTNFSTIPVTSLSGTATPLPSFATGVGGAGAVLLPQFAAGGGWATELVIANTGTGSMTVRVDLFKQDGTPLTASLNGQSASSFTNLVIPAGGVLGLAPRNTNGDDDF